VTTEQELKLPSAEELGGGEEEGAAALVAAALAAGALAAAALVAGALAAGALAAGALDADSGADEDDEVQAASERAAELAMTEIAIDCRRI
jgi:hypothetical protein